MADEGCEGGEDSSSQWLIGATMNITGSIMINLGTNLMKFGHMEAEKAAEAEKSTAEGSKEPAKKGSWWQVGMGLFVLGNLLNFTSFSFANQSLLAALGSVQFVTNVAFGRLVLKMVISANVIIGTAIIVFANVIIVAFTQGDGDECAPTLSSKDLASLYLETNYIIYLSCCAVAGVASYAGYRILKARPRPPMNLLGVCYVISSAVIGTQSVTLCKSLSTLIRDSLQGNNQFIYPFTYVVIVGTICTAVFWVKRMSAALKKFDALFIIPVLQVFWTSLSIVGGGVYYKEFDQYSMHSLSIFICCMVAIFIGVYMLAPSGEEGAAIEDDRIKRHREATMQREDHDITSVGGSVGGASSSSRGSASSSTARSPRRSTISQSRMRGESWLGSMSMPVLIMAPDEKAVDAKAWGEDGGRFSMMDKDITGLQLATSEKVRGSENTVAVM
jgi:drug/metabolite transporter (DMT)-like permease